MDDHCLTANRGKACARMLADQSKAFQILPRSCCPLSRSPQLASYSFSHVPRQIPESPSELFTETGTCDSFYASRSQEGRGVMGYSISWHRAHLTLVLIQGKGTESRQLMPISVGQCQTAPLHLCASSSKINIGRCSMIIEHNSDITTQFTQANVCTRHKMKTLHLKQQL